MHVSDSKRSCLLTCAAKARFGEPVRRYRKRLERATILIDWSNHTVRLFFSNEGFA